MKLKPLLILGLPLGLGIVSATAGGRNFGDGLPEYLKQFDVNDDGVIDEEERQAIREARDARHDDWIAQWDTDGDGVLSEAEKEAAREAIRAGIEAKRAERFALIAGDDACLSLEEFAAVPALADADPARVEALFNRIDADDDGKVTIEEFNSRLRHHRKPGDRR
jgi:Ca2+-binding EF-hand superfamily protein